MTVLATAVLLASSLAFPSPGHVRAADVEPNPMLRYAAVDHDLVKVKRRIKQALHSDATDGTQLFAAPGAVR